MRDRGTRGARPLVDRRVALALLFLAPLPGCMVGGLRPPIRQRFASVEIHDADLVADLAPAERARLLATLRLSAADTFRNHLRPGDPSLPRLDVALVSLTLAPATAADPSEARDRLVAEWSLAPAAGGRGPVNTVYATREPHSVGGALTETRPDRLDMLCGRLWDATWDDLRRS